MLSLLYARTYPRDVSALVLVDPPTPNFPQWLSPSAYAGNIEALADPGPSPIPGYAKERHRLDTLFAEIDAAAPLPPVPVTDLVRTVDAPAPDPLPAGLSRSDYQDIQTRGAAAADAYVRGIPGARVVPVPGGSHNLHLERPDAVVDAVREALARATTPPT